LYGGRDFTNAVVDGVQIGGQQFLAMRPEDQQQLLLTAEARRRQAADDARWQQYWQSVRQGHYQSYVQAQQQSGMPVQSIDQWDPALNSPQQTYHRHEYTKLNGFADGDPSDPALTLPQFGGSTYGTGGLDSNRSYIRTEGDPFGLDQDNQSRIMQELTGAIGSGLGTTTWDPSGMGSAPGIPTSVGPWGWTPPSAPSNPTTTPPGSPGQLPITPPGVRPPVPWLNGQVPTPGTPPVPTTGGNGTAGNAGGSASGNASGNAGGGMGGPGGSPAPVTDPNALPRYITPENTLRNQRIGFDVNPGSLAEAAKAAIAAQLPALDQQFGDEVERHAKATAAMGRTGSGMFDKEFGRISDRAQIARDALFAGHTFDANRRDLDANLATDLSRVGHLVGERNYDDRLARYAMDDEANRLRFLSTAFDDSIGADSLLMSALMGGANMYGANAGQLNGQVAGGLSALIDPGLQLLMSIFARNNNGGGTASTGDNISGGLA
jgi:hypothetical protein